MPLSIICWTTQRKKRSKLTLLERLRPRQSKSNCSSIKESQAGHELAEHWPGLTRKSRGSRRKNEALFRKSRAMQKKVERMRKWEITAPTPSNVSSDHSGSFSPSPRTSADREICASGLSPSQYPRIQQKLLVENSIASELRQAQKENKEQAGSLRNVVAGRIVKKYRLVKAVSEETKLDRRKMTLSVSKLITNCTRKRQNTLKSTMSSHIVAFLQRDDNSRMMPGKTRFQDCKRR